MKLLVRCAALLAVSAVVASTWSCASDGNPTAAALRLGEPAAPHLLGSQLLACTPMTADSVTQAIGPAGGTLYVGPHQLVVPAGALDSTVSITAVAPSDTVNRVDLFPEGLTFNTPVSLKLSYANCGLLSPLIPKSVVYLNGLSIQSLVTSLDSFLTLTVTGSLEHFSGYAVAW